MKQLHQEKIKLSSELSSIEETKIIITEKILLENIMSNFDKFDYADKIEKLKLDLKRSKILLKDAQKTIWVRKLSFRI